MQKLKEAYTEIQLLKFLKVHGLSLRTTAIEPNTVFFCVIFCFYITSPSPCPEGQLLQVCLFVVLISKVYQCIKTKLTIYAVFNAHRPPPTNPPLQKGQGRYFLISSLRKILSFVIFLLLVFCFYVTNISQFDISHKKVIKIKQN